jgi:hypothetical protein
MIGNRGAPPLAGRIDVAAGTAGRAQHPRVDSAISAYGSGAGLAEERRTRGGGHAFSLRVSRQGDREPADGHLRCLRIVRHAGAGRFHRADAQPVRPYLALACVGAGNIVLGTFCSRNAWLAAAAMAMVGFAILFSGVINGYFAAAGTSALLTFILPLTIPGSFSEVPARLEGWGLAAAAAICAHMLLWPTRPRATLRSDAARACCALADLAETELADDSSTIPSRTAAAREAVEGLRRSFLAAPHRPNGPTGPTAALASLVDELDWLLSFLAPQADLPSLDLCREENAEAVAATVAALRASAATLAGGNERPDFQRIEVARDAVAQALVRRISELPPPLDDDGFGSALEPPFRVRVISYSARQVAGYALLASGIAAPELDELDVAGGDYVTRPTRGSLLATERFAVEHAGTKSVWFRNSIRGAAGLAVAVYIAQRSGLQHSFWVVLGTLSVLRSNALSTGWSVLSALAGTAAGIVVGAGLVIAIGTHEHVLWAVLPLAVLLAAYAPRAISFAAGCCGRAWLPLTDAARTTSSRRLGTSSMEASRVGRRVRQRPRRLLSTSSTMPFDSLSPSGLQFP